MDSELLVEQKDDGRRLVEQLVRDGFEVAAAFWAVERGRVSWQLYIASPLVEGRNSDEAYRRLIPLIAKVPSKWATISNLDLLDPENPIVKAAVEIRDRDPDGRAVSYEGGRLGDMEIQGAYIYPEIAPARLLFTVRYARVDDANRWNAEVHYDGFHPGLRARATISYTVAGYNDRARTTSGTRTSASWSRSTPSSSRSRLAISGTSSRSPPGRRGWRRTGCSRPATRRRSSSPPRNTAWFRRGRAKGMD